MVEFALHKIENDKEYTRRSFVLNNKNQILNIK